MSAEISVVDRKAWLSLLATADEAQLAELWAGLNHEPPFHWLRVPEVGGVMVRGRMGGTGAPFNLGEMTVTRCTVSLETGTVGHGYVQGRSKTMAETAAKLDALMQTDKAHDVAHAILEPLRMARMARQEARAAKAAATKVEFFTMVRGED